MNKQRLAILICSAVGVLATFMPWINVPIIGSINGTQGSLPGWITLLIFAVPLVISLLGDRTKNLEQTLLYIAIAAGVIDAGIAIYKIVDFNNKTSPLSGNSSLTDNPIGAMLGSTISVGFGLYLVVVAGVAIVIASLALKDKAIAGKSASVTENV